MTAQTSRDSQLSFMMSRPSIFDIMGDAARLNADYRPTTNIRSPPVFPMAAGVKIMQGIERATPIQISTIPTRCRRIPAEPRVSLSLNLVMGDIGVLQVIGYSDDWRTIFNEKEGNLRDVMSIPSRMICAPLARRLRASSADPASLSGREPSDPGGNWLDAATRKSLR
jgi:hypothetical protein